MFQGLKLLNALFQPRAMCLIFALPIAKLRQEFALQALQTARPAVASTDHCRIHESFSQPSGTSSA